MMNMSDMLKMIEMKKKANKVVNTKMSKPLLQNVAQNLGLEINFMMENIRIIETNLLRRRILYRILETMF